jgi:hypothetical protein
MHACRSLLLSFAMLVACTAQAAPEKSEYNLGVEAYRVKDYASARAHWAKAVEEGEPSAFNNLGFLLHNGLGGAADQVRAVALWKTAAARGHSESQWHLAQAFEDGEGVAMNMVEAYAWYRCAVASMQAAPEEDDESTVAGYARDSIIKLVGILPTEQLAAAEQLARSYIAKYAAKPGG